MKKLIIILIVSLLTACSFKMSNNKVFLNYVKNPKDTAAIKNLLNYYSEEPYVEHYLFLAWRTILEKPYSKLSVSIADNYSRILYYVKLNPIIRIKRVETANWEEKWTEGKYEITRYRTTYAWRIPDHDLRYFMYKYDKDSTNLPLYEKNFQLIRNYFIALEKNCLKWQDYRTNIDYEFAYFAKFFLELYKRDLTEPFSYYIFAAYSEDNEEIRNYLNNNSSKVLPLEEFIENYNWDQILE